ncbi:hypothetical protein L9F63_021291, partial [Diploptera punctata]
IYCDPRCYPEYLIHDVLIVGYGMDDHEDYWIVKHHGLVTGVKEATCGCAEIRTIPVEWHQMQVTLLFICFMNCSS